MDAEGREALFAAPHWDEMAGRERGLSWLASAVVHLVLFLIFSWWWSPPPRGVDIESDREVGIVLVNGPPEQAEYFGPDSEESSSAGAAASSAASGSGPAGIESALPGGDSSPVDPMGFLPSGDAPGAGGGGSGLPGAGDLAQGSGSGSAGKVGSGKGQTSLFGIQGDGNKFLYVFDRSASMEGYEGRPLAAAKSELQQSIAKLGPAQQFQIIFYNDRQNVFNPYLPQPPRMLFADQKHKDLARRYVQGVAADGGTRHLDALRMALRLNPDVLFFLTDADEPELTHAELADLDRTRGETIIHAIEFGAGPARRKDNFLVRLAKMTGGKHVYVDVTTLSRRGGR